MCRFALTTLTEEMKVYMPEPDSYTCELCVCLKEEIEEEGNMVGQYCFPVGNHGMDERLVILLLFAHPHSMQLYN